MGAPHAAGRRGGGRDPPGSPYIDARNPTRLFFGPPGEGKTLPSRGHSPTPQLSSASPRAGPFLDSETHIRRLHQPGGPGGARSASSSRQFPPEGLHTARFYAQTVLNCIMFNSQLAHPSVPQFCGTLDQLKVRRLAPASGLRSGAQRVLRPMHLGREYSIQNVFAACTRSHAGASCGAHVWERG